VSAQAKSELNRHFRRIEQKLPRKGARMVRWLRRPSSRMVRVPVSAVLIVGGFFGFLPVLGFWMVPLGVLLVAQDVPFLQPPLAGALGWVERKWIGGDDSSPPAADGSDPQDPQR
jgi:hypothetical protein